VYRGAGKFNISKQLWALQFLRFPIKEGYTVLYGWDMKSRISKQR